MARIVPSLQLARTEDYCYTLHLHLHFHRSIENFSAYCILHAALFSAALPVERLRSAGSLAITVICFKKSKFGKKKSKFGWPGAYSQMADALSRFSWQEFWHKVPETQPLPTPVPTNVHLHSDHILRPTDNLFPSSIRLVELQPSSYPLPTNQWLLCPFATFLAGKIQHSLKVRGQTTSH